MGKRKSRALPVSPLLQHFWPLGKRVVWWKCHGGRVDYHPVPSLVVGWAGRMVLVAPICGGRDAIHRVSKDKLEPWHEDQHGEWGRGK